MATLFLSIPSAFAFDFESAVQDGTYKTYALETEHFILEYDAVVKAMADTDGDGIADVLEKVAEYSEYSWTQEIETLGLKNPLKNQDKILIILDDEAEYLIADSYGITFIMEDDTIYIALDPNLTDELFQVTLAHELVHVVQFSYQGFFVGYDQDTYFAEQTAVALEEYVYPDIDDYVGYVPEFLGYPDYSVFTGILPSEESLFAYGSVLWPLFVVQHLNDWSFMPKLLDSYFYDEVADVWDAYEAYQRVLDEDYNEDIKSLFQTFTMWNYVLGYYDDGDDYSGLSIEASYPSTAYPLEGISVSDDAWPALFGASYLQFDIDSSMWGGTYQFTLQKPLDVEMGLVFLPETEDMYLTDDVYITSIGAEFEEGIEMWSFASGVTRLTVIVTPFSDDPAALEAAEDAFSVGYKYIYGFDVSSDETIDSTGGTEVTESTDGMDGIETKGTEGTDASGEGEDEWDFYVIPEGTEEHLDISGLKITNSDPHSVSLQWNRVLEDGVSGYTVYYGVEEGLYLDKIDVPEPHLIRTTVNDLGPSMTYYFAVTAYTDDGLESAEYEEVSTTLPGIVFDDVAKSHTNYNAIQFLAYVDVIQGYDDATFRPDASINRAELLKILVGSTVFEIPTVEEYNNCFDDVQDQWFTPYICYAAEQDWVNGYSDGNFYPERMVTKVEALKMILNAFEADVPGFVSTADLPFNDVYSSQWYAPYIVAAYELGILEETDGAFNPNATRVRVEIAEEIFRHFVIDSMFDVVYTDELLESFLEIYGDLFLASEQEA